MPHSKTMRFPRSAEIQKMEVKNVLFSDPVNGIKSQNSQQLFSVTAPMIFWVEMHILWSGLSSFFHIYSMYCHHLYEFPVIKASVSSSIRSLCHTLFPSFNSPNTPSPTLFKTWIWVPRLQSTHGHGPACPLGLYGVPAQGSRVSSSLNSWELLDKFKKKKKKFFSINFKV